MIAIARPSPCVAAATALPTWLWKVGAVLLHARAWRRFLPVRPYMTNRGGQIFGGPGEVVSVQTTIENTTATEGEAFFSCDEEVLEGASSTCRHELENGLLPHYLGISPRGQSFDHRFDISGLPADQDTVEACSSIILAEGQTDSDPSDNEICVTIQICDEDVCDADMAAYPRTSGVCYRGQTCSIGASVLPGPWLSGVDTSTIMRLIFL
jgi:hypothetical protein